MDTRACAAGVSTRFRRAPVQPGMRSMPIVITLEVDELRLQIRGRPEERTVQTFPPNRSDQPFDEGMRERHVRHRLDFPQVEYPQIRLPSVEPIQRIMIRAEVCRRGLAPRRSIEHPAQPQAVHDAAVHAKADDRDAYIGPSQRAPSMSAGPRSVQKLDRRRGNVAIGLALAGLGTDRATNDEVPCL